MLPNEPKEMERHVKHAISGDIPKGKAKVDKSEMIICVHQIDHDIRIRKEKERNRIRKWLKIQ